MKDTQGMTDQKVWLITGAGRGMGVDMAKAALDAGPAGVAGAAGSGRCWDAPRAASGPAASTRDVAFQEPDDADHAAIDHAYQAKYARYARSYVEPMVSPDATAATLRLVPR
jgi:NAD(P)-dependent dehydrogenase (short-subunit alcohol dehydrogenase family)